MVDINLYYSYGCEFINQQTSLGGHHLAWGNHPPSIDPARFFGSWDDSEKSPIDIYTQNGPNHGVLDPPVVHKTSQFVLKIHEPHGGFLPSRSTNRTNFWYRWPIETSTIDLSNMVIFQFAMLVF
jgi:hypothetical protein